MFRIQMSQLRLLTLRRAVAPTASERSGLVVRPQGWFPVTGNPRQRSTVAPDSAPHVEVLL